MRWVNIEQNTPEWLQLRAGKVGGSSIGKIMANYGKSFGQPARDLAVKIALERLTGSPIDDGYTNAHMERGKQQEPIARALYEAENFVWVKPGGYYTDDDLIGVSPDGLVDDDGLIEIKSVIYTKQYETLFSNSFDLSYKWQLCYNLKNSGREWIDYVSYCAQFPIGNQLFQERIFGNECGEYFEKIDQRMDEFKKLLDKTTKVIRGKR